MSKKIMIIMNLSALDSQTRSTGGVDTVCQMHLEGLKDYASDKHDYLILAFNPANDLDQNAQEHQIKKNIKLVWYNADHREHKLNKFPNVICNEWIVRKYIKKFQPDIVQTHIPSWHIKKYAHEKKMITLHSYQKIARTSVSVLNDFLHEKIIQPIAIKSSDIITSVSMDIVNMLSTRGAVYVPNPISSNFFDINRQISSDDDIKILMSGHILKRKRNDDALKVIKNLHDRGYKNTKLDIAGNYKENDPHYQELKAYIQENHLDQHIKFLGLIDQNTLIEKIKTSHIGLFLSESETFGLAPLEMMATGMPIITTKVGIFDWCAEDFKKYDVPIIPIGDITAAENAIINYINNENYIVHKDLEKFLRQEFSIQSYIEKNMNLIEKTGN